MRNGASHDLCTPAREEEVLVVHRDVERLWNDYLRCWAIAENSRNVHDGIAAGKAWGRFLHEFEASDKNDNGGGSSSRPWMPFYVRDYFADTVHLTTIEHGAYLMLIMHYWLHGGLPSEDTKLVRIVRLPLDEWTEIRPTVADFFDENWRHKRVEAELAVAEERYQKRAAAGQRGGKASASLRQSCSPAEAMLEPKRSHAEGRLNQPQPQPQAKTEEEESQCGAAVPAPASDEDRFWTRLPVLEAKGVNRALCTRILKLTGTDFVAVNRALDRAERARDPDRYLAGVVRKLESGDRTYRPHIDSQVPNWVNERRGTGISVEREGRHWRSQGELLNDDGEAVGC